MASLDQVKRNRNIARTTFQRLENQLAEIIESTPAGQRLKSEPELAAELGVSRATLREAMRSFEGRGLIRRRQGVGTFVLDHRQNIETGLEKLESIETQAKRLGLEVNMGYLGVNRTFAGERFSRKMDLKINDPVVEISRVIRVADHPVAYLIDVLVDGILSEDDLEKGFTGSVLDLIIQRQTPQLSHSKTIITACPATSDIGKKMEMQRSDVLLKLEAYLYDVNERMIDYSESYFAPGFFQFQVNRKVGDQFTA